MSTTFEINHVVHLSAAAVVPNPTVRKYTQNLHSANWLKMVRFTKENINIRVVENFNLQLSVEIL